MRQLGRERKISGFMGSPPKKKKKKGHTRTWTRIEPQCLVCCESLDTTLKTRCSVPPNAIKHARTQLNRTASDLAFSKAGSFDFGFLHPSGSIQKKTPGDRSGPLVGEGSCLQVPKALNLATSNDTFAASTGRGILKMQTNWASQQKARLGLQHLD